MSHSLRNYLFKSLRYNILDETLIILVEKSWFKKGWGCGELFLQN